MESKKRLSSGRWLALFAGTVLLLAAALAAFNFYTDPFGAFGDRFCTWWSYDETNNPRVAKLSYLEQHHDEYDSYILGCSSTSSFPKEQLDAYFDASFYNLITYGADMLDMEQYAAYLLDHYEVKNLVLNVYIDNGFSYNVESNPLTDAMPCAVDGSAALPYYARFLFANPRYGWEKLRHMRSDSVVQAAHDVFDEASGAYDKSRRDVEPIGAMEPYLAAYPEFVQYPESHPSMTEIERCMASVAAIRDRCAAAGVRLTVVCAPVYYDYFRQWDFDQVAAFYEALADVTPYWDFALSSVSREPRYFYDATHFRNGVGAMALARMFGDESVYVPEDFGVYVTADNVRDRWETLRDLPAPDPARYTAQAPILMYHALGDGFLPASQFDAQLAALSEAGYTAVGFDDLRAYVLQGAPLPDKPVVITFDDGYLNNMTVGLPVLERYDMEATIFVIGCSLGKDTYKDTGEAMTPHFSAAQAAEMVAGGRIAIGSHGYNVHEVEGRDAAPIRQGVLPREGESEADYVAFFRDDCRRQNELLAPVLGENVSLFAYPFGLHTELSEILLHEAGIDVTVTTRPGSNTLVQGLPQTLLDLNRYGIDETVTPEALLALLEENET